MKAIVKNHNKDILEKKPSIDTLTCKCRNKEDYLLNGQCQIGEVVYGDTLTIKQPSYKEKKYFGIAKDKGSLYNHNVSFRNRFYKNNIDLSKELWQIKLKNYTPKITYHYQEMPTI